MAKVSVKDFEKWLAGADEEQVAVAIGQLVKERAIADTMLIMANKRKDYLEMINFENCTKRAKALEILPPEASD